MRPQCASGQLSALEGMVAVFASTTCSRAERKDTTSLFLPLNFRCRLEIGLEINFKANRKCPLGGLKLWILFGGRWATRTPGLWFRRPTLYPPELIARAQKFYQMHHPCQGNPAPPETAGPRRPGRPRFPAKGGRLPPQVSQDLTIFWNRWVRVASAAGGASFGASAFTLARRSLAGGWVL